ncbi:PilZ domain-containing protein [Butyrivibrio hungatei DSM 14810]|uniref:PilZ domain-containing protein n=1 Tax=Butyrivibrio hungatei DSM 14810 TaxID=1121132 RepID=A0A1M7S6X2_9FIRM|nr:PilZ domain-containing protein [Butyrivibrio hungatei]SHN54148.1 PilZ domain-containing protein [Butyrivibrio hungatei DSM 14810]
MEERRKGRRLDLSGEIIIKELGGDAETVDIKITDASTAGLGFVSDKQLVIGDNYEANLTIWTKEVLHVIVQIVRAEKRDDGFHYGAMFVGMPEDVKVRIKVFETVEEEKAKQS